MAKTSKTLLCHDVLIPSAFSVFSSRCKWGNILSKTKRNAPPARKPTTAGIQPIPPFSSVISILGANKDQKLAAIITPAAKPSIRLKNFRFMFLKKKTRDAPRAVTPHVKSVPKSANKTGFIFNISS